MTTNFSKIYLDTISEKPTVADFSIKIQGYQINSLFDTGAQVSCISYSCYAKFVVVTFTILLKQLVVHLFKDSLYVTCV